MTRTPRYQTLAAVLREGIVTGRYPVGGQLSTELEICRAEGVSRHTARDALRLLIDEGLVARRQGAGSRVIARRPPSAFVQPLGGPEELMQYARDARLTVRTASQRALTEREATRLAAPVGPPWLVVDGLREAGGDVLASTRLFVAEPYMEIRHDLKTWPGALQELIAQRWGVQVARIEQQICAETLDLPAASVLQADPGSAALRTLRRYYDEHARLIVASDSLHPADRFVYEMSYRRGG